MYNDPYADAPDVVELSSRTLTARKEHSCHKCREAIQPGERYHKLVYLLDGNFYIDKAHDRCPYVERLVAAKKKELAKVEAELAEMGEASPFYRETLDHRDILLSDIGDILMYGL